MEHKGVISGVDCELLTQAKKADILACPQQRRLWKFAQYLEGRMLRAIVYDDNPIGTVRLSNDRFQTLSKPLLAAIMGNHRPNG